ncbi:MAG: type II methionyl aminopeptidase [Methanomassiliicoccales archaeon]
MNPEDRERLLKAGAIAREAREAGMAQVRGGGKVLDVVEEIEELIVKRGGKPAFPVNIGIGSIAAHYTPPAGDEARFPVSGIVKVDVGVHVEGFVADTAGTVALGGNGQSLSDAARNALENALALLGPGASLKAVGMTIENTIKAAGFKPVSNLTGHSIERYSLHAGMSIYNVAVQKDEHLPQEVVIAVEPFATDGKGFVVSGKGGNIYSMVKRVKTGVNSLDEFQDAIMERYNTLPFAERWLSDFKQRREMLARLSRLGALHSYEILVEAGKGVVSQWEHTLIIEREGATVTT